MSDGLESSSRQWGYATSNVEFAYPIAFNTACRALAPIPIQGEKSWYFIGRGMVGNTRSIIYTHYANGTSNETPVGYIAVGE
ncbi:gp53-like domain-containing protein [Megasphaera elsdenii]|uniref:gp53-like domain-containing protein n=1 Tax=Megasphaera elsdenii TaxID=907 RepID=UPI003CFC1A0F